MRRSLISATCAIAIAGMIACAAGDVADGVDDDAGVGDDTDASFPDVRQDAPPGSQFDAPPVDSGAGFDAKPGDGGPKDAGGDGNPAACAAPDDCQGAEVVQSISGDTSPQNNTRTVQGYTSKWFQISVTEDDHSLIGKKLTVTASLTSPPGTNFDLFLYIDEGGSTTSRACGPTASDSSTNASGADTVSHNWGDGALGSGSDDSRIVSLEVRHVSGACDPGAKWTLTITGN